MAIIYQKVIGANPEQCLILDASEAFIYPFDAGDWRELLVGYFLSVTTTSSNNAATTSEEQMVGGSTNYKLNGYWGIKDSGNKFPQISGSSFIGLGLPSGQSYNGIWYTPNSQLLTFRDINATASVAILSEDQNVSYNAANFSYILTPNATQNGNSTNYASWYGQKFTRTVNSNGKTGIYFAHQAGSVVAGPYDSINLRKYIYTNMSTYDTIRTSGYMTSALNVTGVNRPNPNALFVYIPFVNHRLRLHCVVIEKKS